MVSFANCNKGKEIFSLIEYPQNKPNFPTADLTKLANLSATTKNKKGVKGSPCLNPLFTLKSSIGLRSTAFIAQIFCELFVLTMSVSSANIVNVKQPIHPPCTPKKTQIHRLFYNLLNSFSILYIFFVTFSLQANLFSTVFHNWLLKH